MKKYIIMFSILAVLITSAVIIQKSFFPVEEKPKTLSETIADNIRQHPNDWNFKKVVDSTENYEKKLYGYMYSFFYYGQKDYEFQNKPCGIKISYKRDNYSSISPPIAVTILQPYSLGLDCENSLLVGSAIEDVYFSPLELKKKHVDDSTFSYNFAYAKAYDRIMQDKIKSKICK